MHDFIQQFSTQKLLCSALLDLLFSKERPFQIALYLSFCTGISILSRDAINLSVFIFQMVIIKEVSMIILLLFFWYAFELGGSTKRLAT